MSSERPPSQDSIGGHGTKTSSTTIINTTNVTASTTAATTKANMVLSAIPLDSGHVVIQQTGTSSRITTLTNSPTTTTATHHHHQQQQQLQHHIQQQNGNSSNGVLNGNFVQQIHRNSPPKIITTTGGHSIGHHSITKIIGTSNCSSGGGGSGSVPSKYVIFQPNGHYTTNDAFIGQTNGVGNIVIVATEPMDISHPEQQQLQQHHQQITSATGTTIINTNGSGIGATDEELTSLTWLTDKNLIKGLVTCSNKTTNGQTIQGLNNNNNINNNINSPGRQINCINSNNVGSSSSGTETPLSPTSDFMEDSSISDENLSSANSSSITNQGIRVRKNLTNDYTTSIHLDKSQQQQHHNQYTNNNKNINNNNTISKNRNNIISPINTVNFTTNNTSSNNNNNNNLIQQLQEHQSHHLNGNLATALGATTTVHVGPSGTTTVVEYKSTTNQNYLQTSTANRHNIPNQQQVPHSTTTINSSTSSNISSSTISPIITQQQQQQQHNKTLNNSFNPIIITSSTIPKSTQILSPNSMVSSSSSSSTTVPLVVSTVTTTPTPAITTATTTTTTTHHPHKKYLREQMNGFDHQQQQQQQQNSNNNNNNGATTNGLNINQYSPMPSSNILPYLGNNSTTSLKINNNQSMLSITESPPRDYHQQQQQHHSTPNKYADYDNDSLKDYEIPNGTLSSSSSSSNGRISSSAQKQNNNNNNNTSSSSGSLSPSKQKHPTNMPYDPYIHTNSKPPYSFSSLIFMAIEDSPEKALPVKEIYAWIVHHFPYFKTAPTGWKNSVRHNLSLNKSFLKVEKAPNMGKGSLWRVEQLQRPNLIQALARSPFHPCSAIDKHLQQHKNNLTNSSSSSLIKYNGSNGIDSPPMTPVKSNLDARLFPKLSKMIREITTKSDSSIYCNNNNNNDTIKLSDNLGLIDNNNDGITNFNNNNSNILNKNIDYYSTNKNNNCITSNISQNYENVERLARDCGADSIDDVNAATAMLALKHGPKVFTDTFNNGSPVITNSPSEDHTYSAGGGSSGSGSSSSGGGGGGNNIIIVGSSGICSSNSSVTGQIGSHNGSDNVSNGVSSDAAYESSEESHNITAEELEEQRRVEGVDALLSLSSMFDISSTPSPSPIKRPSSTIIEEEHISSYMENIPHLNGKGILAANNNSTIDEGYNTPASYYSRFMSNTNISTPVGVTLSGSIPKKLKQTRGIRAKIKRKTAWIR